MNNDYYVLMNLKRTIEGNPYAFELYKRLNNYKDTKSNNILVICRTVKNAREAIRMSAKNYIDRAKFNLIQLWLEIDDIRIYFLPMSRIDDVVGLHYKEYYFDETFKGV